MDAPDPARRPRLDDVAAEVGVSSATVSLVLRGIAGPSAATRERVLAASERLGYRPDRAASVLASRRSRLIGIMVDINNPYQLQLIDDVHEAAGRHGYTIILSAVTRGQDETRAIETLLDSRCEGLILLGPEAGDQRLNALGRQLPLVVVGRPVRSSVVDVVRSDDQEGMEQTIAYLVGLGHRHIPYIDGGKGVVPTLRRRIYRGAMSRHHLVDHIQVIPGGATEGAGGLAARAMLQADRLPTAVMAFNDRCAMGLIDALIRADVDLPGSISIVGYDDSTVARLAHVDLTTVSQNTHQLTEHAVTALLTRLADRGAEREDLVVPPHLVVRGTTGPPRDERPPT